MKYLLDTCVLLWFLGDPDRISEEVKDILLDDYNEVFVSSASLWEISIKKSVGKLQCPSGIEIQLDSNDFQELPIDFSHAIGVEDLPMTHKDPFDRMLISQAKSDGLTLITSDEIFSQYLDTSSLILN